jgi:hypothetical protein
MCPQARQRVPIMRIWRSIASDCSVIQCAISHQEDMQSNQQQLYSSHSQSSTLSDGLLVQQKIGELSEQVIELQQDKAIQSKKEQELLLSNEALRAALCSQSEQLKQLSNEFSLFQSWSISNMYVPSSSLQFDPSEDILLKYPVTAPNGTAEYITLINSCDIKECVSCSVLVVQPVDQSRSPVWIHPLPRQGPLICISAYLGVSCQHTYGLRHTHSCRGGGIQHLTKMMREDWIPELQKHAESYNDAMKAMSCNSNRSGALAANNESEAQRQQAAAEALAALDDKCSTVQRLFVECCVKTMRIKPVRTRLFTTDPLFNCHTALEPDKAWAKAQEVRQAALVQVTALCTGLTDLGRWMLVSRTMPVT